MNEFKFKTKTSFKFYGDFNEMDYIYKECKNKLFFVKQDHVGVPIFTYEHMIDINLDNNSLYNNVKTYEYNINKLKQYLRKIKIKKYTKNELTDTEKTDLVFFNFYLKSIDDKLVKFISSNMFVV